MSPSIRYGLLPLVARVLVILEFLVAVNGKITGWSDQAGYMASKGMSFITPLLVAALVIELIGSLLVIAGFRTRAAAAVMFIYLGIVSIRLHDFWMQSGMAAAQNETHFFKNLGMMGGLLMLAVYGAGTWSIDARLASSKSRARAS